MPCDMMAKDAEDQRRRQKAIDAITAKLADGTMKVVRSLNGTVSLVGYAQTGAASLGLCEGCVLRRIQNAPNTPMRVRQALKAGGVSARPFLVASHRGHNH